VHTKAVEKAKSHMPTDDRLLEVAELYKVFADATRVKMLFLLNVSELCVCDIAAALEMTQSAISHQLRILKSASLVKSVRRGKAIFYSLSDDHVATILAQGIEHTLE
ncbi:MAG: metalloregulator ArsR/SmtB family transcription factor, partial [Oscillospiraceae bacterium]